MYEWVYSTGRAYLPLPPSLSSSYTLSIKKQDSDCYQPDELPALVGEGERHLLGRRLVAAARGGGNGQPMGVCVGVCQ